MWYVYLLECADKSIYTGATTDVAKRLKAHSAGKGGAYTRSHRPVNIIYIEKARSRGGALKREAVIKRLTRQKKLELAKRKK